MGNCLACFKMTSKQNDINAVSNSIKIDDTVIQQHKNGDGQSETRDRKEKGKTIYI